MATGETLSDLLRSAHEWGQHNLYALCERQGCGHQAKLDIPALIAKLGPNFPTMDIRSRLRCARCGARGDDIRLQQVYGHKPAGTEPQNPSDVPTG